MQERALWSAAVFVPLVFLGAMIGACSDKDRPDEAASSATASAPESLAPGTRTPGDATSPPAPLALVLRDDAGTPDFRHDPGMTGRRFAIEQLGAGGALFDCDGDGDLDLLCLNGGPLPGSPSPKANALFLNDGRGNFRRSSDLGDLADPKGYAVGCAVADVDRDGDEDVFVTRYGRDLLFLNDGRGRFLRQDNCGITEEAWSAGAVFADVNGDGLLDLYVTRYLNYRVEEHEPCFRRDLSIYCGPQQHVGVPDRLYQNLGEGRFRDVSASALPASSADSEAGKGLGVAAADIDGDGDVDLYVANDQTPNQLLLNDGQGHFEDIGDIAGVAVSRDGEAEAGMGTVMADLDGDGDPEIVVTNFEDQTNALYRNEGEGFFLESSWEAGLGFSTRADLAWGVLALDLDLDGRRDLVFANGHVYDNAAKVRDDGRWAQPDRVFLNRGELRFSEPKQPLPALATPRVSRGLAAGDLDGDGDLDLVFFDLGTRVRVLRNDARGARVQLDAVSGPKGHRIIGTQIELRVSDHLQCARICGAGSYLAHSDPRAHFGLGSAQNIESLTVRWPDGGRHRFASLPANCRLVVERSGRLRGFAFDDGRLLFERTP